MARKRLLAGASASPAAEARFVREARATAHLDHPNVVPVYELGRDEAGALYYTMKRVEGETLGARLRSARALSARLALLDAFVGVCQAVAHAHARGVIHRDLKPENVMLGEFGEAFVMDWGLVREEAADMQGGDRSLTVGAVGTPAYMSPEQGAGGPVDARTDVWALGVMLSLLLTGSLPFGPGGYRSGADRRPVRAIEPAAPAELAAVVERALRTAPDERYRDAGELLADISAWQRGLRVGAYRYSAREVVMRWVRRHAQQLGAVAVGVVVAGWGAYSALSAAEAARVARAVADGQQAERLRSAARSAWDAGDAGLAWVRAAEALSLEEDPDARGLLVAAASRRAPRLLPSIAPLGTACGPVSWGSDGLLALPEDGLWVRSGGEWRHHRGLDGFKAWGPPGEVWVAPTKGPLARVKLDTGARRELPGTPAGGVWSMAELSGGGVLLGHPDLGGLATVSPGGDITHLPSPLRGQIRAVAVSGDPEPWAAAVDSSGQVFVFPLGRPESGSLLPTRRTTYGLAWGPDHQWLALASDRAGVGHDVEVWDVAGHRRIARLTGHTSTVDGLAVSAGGGWLATAGRDGQVLLWETRRFDLVHRMGAGGEISRVAFSPDGDRVVTVTRGCEVREWSVPDGLRREPARRVWDAVLDGAAVAGVGPDGVARWSSGTPSLRPGVPLPEGDVVEAEVSPEAIVTGDSTGHLRWLDPGTGAEKATAMLDSPPEGLAFDPTGKWLAAVTLRSLRVYDLAGRPAADHRFPDAERPWAAAVSWSPDGGELIAQRDGRLYRAPAPGRGATGNLTTFGPDNVWPNGPPHIDPFGNAVIWANNLRTFSILTLPDTLRAVETRDSTTHVAWLNRDALVAAWGNSGTVEIVDTHADVTVAILPPLGAPPVGVVAGPEGAWILPGVLSAEEGPIALDALTWSPAEAKARAANTVGPRLP